MTDPPGDNMFEPDPRFCPLCGANNCCALEVERATGEPQPPCWCTGVTIDASVLDRIAPSHARISCLCPTCATTRAAASSAAASPQQPAT